MHSITKKSLLQAGYFIGTPYRYEVVNAYIESYRSYSDHSVTPLHVIITNSQCSQFWNQHLTGCTEYSRSRFSICKTIVLVPNHIMLANFSKSSIYTFLLNCKSVFLDLTLTTLPKEVLALLYQMDVFIWFIYDNIYYGGNVECKPDWTNGTKRLINALKARQLFASPNMSTNEFEMQVNLIGCVMPYYRITHKITTYIEEVDQVPVERKNVKVIIDPMLTTTEDDECIACLTHKTTLGRLVCCGGIKSLCSPCASRWFVQSASACPNCRAPQAMLAYTKITPSIIPSNLSNYILLGDVFKGMTTKPVNMDMMPYSIRKDHHINMFLHNEVDLWYQKMSLFNLGMLFECDKFVINCLGKSEFEIKRMWHFIFTTSTSTNITVYVVNAKNTI